MADIKVYQVDEPYLKLNCSLGEAPHWEEKHNSLRFVDLIKRQVHYIDLEKGPDSHRVQQLVFSIGITGDIDGDDERFVFAGKHGYGIVNRITGDWKYIKLAWSDEDFNSGKDQWFRANDGGIDSEGRFWASWMNDQLIKRPSAEAVLMRLDPDLSLSTHVTDLTIPNGTRWSPSNTTLYLADSPTGLISQHDFDAKTGGLSNERPFYKIEDDSLPGDAVPDGHCIDVDGNVWTAVHGRGKVLQISPEGKLLAEIRLPTRCVTCPVFVGDNLFITSMKDESPDEGEGWQRSKELAGSLFKVHVGTTGIKSYKFKPTVELPKV
ncbi:hypothetical protein EJ05DRAFT_119979 [Pseudovirgaria hyperparasitica]|uniref:SMP-30/Gluconolactonase/LRE-like region domain-containing protein n=1 Tax=Pseudovirgaria hyperparasitica TaxID=470096 RepID=A0A6A6VZ63_9PEZI|nr:uncharacterized protein EJ05DRAFT_119979 [Pseudovirgaria hyperparasitica]KAF2755044.1 hypothetical protein EJ05DRAFT_119979 [Pseudovirgaria hyperparasitica]